MNGPRLSFHTGLAGIARGAFTLSAMALVLLAIGCGRHRSQQSSASSSSDVVADKPASGYDAVPVSGTVETAPQADSKDDGEYATSANALPPEVAASAAVTTVTPGHVVQITAEGSTDVMEVTLTDDLGQKRPFAYDPATQDWRVFYRVPLKVSSNRLGLSVTAKNGADRWRRVWLFLDLQRDEIGVSPDSIASP